MPDYSRGFRAVKGVFAFCFIVCSGVSAWEMEEGPATWGDWGYRPAEDSVADVNPPPFTWRPEEKAAAYDLEIAADSEFNSIRHAVEKTPWSAHCPGQVLAPGTYFWRYRAHDEDGAVSGWSVVRRFNVPEGATVFPMPQRALQAMLIPRTHPRLFMRPEEVSPLREQADGPLKKQWEAILKQAEKLLAEPPDTTEPPKYPEGTEHKGAEWRRIWWGNRTHAIAASDGAATLAFAYCLTGERRYGEAARDLLLAVCEWDPKGATNYRYNDEAAMPLLYYPARAYTWAHEIFTPEERARIEAVMRVRGEDCFNSLRGRRHLWRPYGSHHNRAWHKLGELAVAFHDVIPEAPAWLDYIMTIFYTCYPVWGDADGGWHEGQAYWVSYLARFMNWALIMQSPFGINVFEKPFFKHAGDFGLYTCPPGTQTGGFGDLACANNSQRIAQFMGLMGAVADNPYWQWFSEQHGNPRPGGYFGFLIAAQGLEVEARPPEDLPTAKVFRGTGVAVLNTTLLDGRENVQVHFKSSPFGTQSHGYNANNAFLLHLRGERALIMSGRRDIHGSPHHTQWMWETKSDNAILVNGEGQIPHTPAAQGRITHFHTSERLDVVAGEAGESYSHLDRWARRILFFKPGVILIHDVLDAPEPSTFQWLLHAQHAFDLRQDSVGLETPTGTVDVDFLAPAGLALSQKNEFDTPPHDWATFTLDEWHLTAATQSPEKTLHFITMLRIDGAEATATLAEEDGGRLLTLALGDATARVRLHPDRFEITLGDFSRAWEDEMTDTE